VLEEPSSSSILVLHALLKTYNFTSLHSHHPEPKN